MKLLYLLVFSCFGNEVCKEALRNHEMTPNLKKVLESCKGSHGANDKLLKTLLKQCDKWKLSKDILEKCQVDAYRFISWGEYP